MSLTTYRNDGKREAEARRIERKNAQPPLTTHFVNDTHLYKPNIQTGMLETVLTFAMLPRMYPKDYNPEIQYSLTTTSEFDAWLSGLRDTKAKARIIARLISAELGNFGDTRSVGERVSEMRIHHGPGYRVYFSRQGQIVYLLLCGGDKSSQWRT